MGKTSAYPKWDTGKASGYTCLNCETKLGRATWVKKGIRFCSVKCGNEYIKRGKQQ